MLFYLLFLSLITFTLPQEQESCLDSACLSTELNTDIKYEPKATTLVQRNSPPIQPGTILLTSSGLKLQLIQKIGVLGEQSPECLPAAGKHSVTLQSMEVEFISKQGLLLAASTTEPAHLSLAPPSHPLPTYFTGLDVAVLSPKPLTTRMEDKDPTFIAGKSSYYNPKPLATRMEEKDSTSKSGKHSYYNYEQYDKGSCGEVWKARKIKDTGDDEDNNDDEDDDEEYILKRIFVHRGKNVWYSGWREILFGNLLSGLPNCARFVEYFEVGTYRKDKNNKRDDAQQAFNDLWLVFHDEGESLRNFLYSNSQNGNLVQSSKEWLQMRTLGADTFTVIRDIMYNILNGLKQIHARGVTHRDIKPSNIVVRKASSRSSKVILKLVDFGSSLYSSLRRKIETKRKHDRRRKKEYKEGGEEEGEEDEEEDGEQEQFKHVPYGDDGPTTYDMTPAYMPLDLRIQTLFLSQREGGESFVPVASDAMTVQIDVWSAGIVLLEMVLGTDKPFAISGRRKMKLKRRIEKHRHQQQQQQQHNMKNTMPTVEQMVDVIALLEGAKEYCIVPVSPPKESANKEGSGSGSSSSSSSSSSTGTMLQEWLNEIKIAIVGKAVGKAALVIQNDQNTSNNGNHNRTKSKTSKAKNQHAWWEHIQPFINTNQEEEEDAVDECDEDTILRTLLRRDPLHLGLSLMKEYEAKEMVELLRGLLQWDPQQRVTADEALNYPIFQGMKTMLQ